MGGVSYLAQCALDFLIEERCHGCGNAGVYQNNEKASALSAPVTVFSLGSFQLKTRLLCDACAAEVKSWPGELILHGFDGLSAVYPAFVTDDSLLAVIHLLKFSRHQRIAPWLAHAMAAHLPDFSHRENCVVIPVPMERGAQRRRGFNQAGEIARALAYIWKLPIDGRALKKVRATKAQSTLGREERLTNVEGAFHADPGRAHDVDVILVDDLVTTGATLRACAAALRRAGARRVAAVCAGYRDEAAPGHGALPQS
jgi:ComF family protein